MPQVNPIDRINTEPYRSHELNRAARLHHNFDLMVYRATRKGMRAGKAANGKPEAEWKQLKKHNPYSEPTKQAAWLSAFESNGQPKKD